MKPHIFDELRIGKFSVTNTNTVTHTEGEFKIYNLSSRQMVVRDLTVLKMLLDTAANGWEVLFDE